MKAFTLVEMLLVMVIMGFILMMGCYFSNGQLQEIQTKTVKEDLLSTYQSYYLKNLFTSVYHNQKYSHLNIKFSTENNQISFSFLPVSQSEESDSSSLTEMYKSDFDLVSANIFGTRNYSWFILQLTPYTLWCSFTGENLDTSFDVAVFILQAQNEKKYCFEISTQTCRIKEKACEENETD